MNRRRDATVVAAVLVTAALVVLALHRWDRTVYTSFFGWPSGGIWSNLLASLILFTGGFVAGKRYTLRLHNTRMALQQAHHEQLLALQHEHYHALITEIKSRT